MDRDFIKEFLTYIQVEKGLARHTLDSYKRDLDRLHTWAGANKKQITELTRSICESGSRVFRVKDWRQRRSRARSAPRAGSSSF